jgi:hypothetical protein
MILNLIVIWLLFNALIFVALIPVNEGESLTARVHRE